MKTIKTSSKTTNSATATPQQKRLSSSSRNSKTAEQIAIAAYLKAEARGFEPGHELEDWLEAEAENQ